MLKLLQGELLDAVLRYLIPNRLEINSCLSLL